MLADDARHWFWKEKAKTALESMLFRVLRRVSLVRSGSALYNLNRPPKNRETLWCEGLRRFGAMVEPNHVSYRCKQTRHHRTRPIDMVLQGLAENV